MKRRNSMLKSIIVLIILSFTIVAVLPSASYAETKSEQLGRPTAANTFIDALIYRPIGLVCIPLGAALFVVSLPFSATGGNVKRSFHNLVVEPFDYTFHRPLGDI